MLAGFHKIHAVCDALGNPFKFILSEVQQSDYKQALPLLTGLKSSAVLADKGYDADYVIEAVKTMRAEVVIPPKQSR